MASGTRISQLAETIATNTAIVDAYLKEHGLPTPSFSADGPASLAIQDDAVAAAQERVIASTQELHFLMKGPAESLLGIAVSLQFRKAVRKSNLLRALPPTTL